MLLVSWGCRISAYTSSRNKKETVRPYATLSSGWYAVDSLGLCASSVIAKDSS